VLGLCHVGNLVIRFQCFWNRADQCRNGDRPDWPAAAGQSLDRRHGPTRVELGHQRRGVGCAKSTLAGAHGKAAVMLDFPSCLPIHVVAQTTQIADSLSFAAAEDGFVGQG
jgi:hypothetical protein